MVQDWGIAGQPGSDDVITGRRSGTKANGGNQAKTIGAWCAFAILRIGSIANGDRGWMGV